MHPQANRASLYGSSALLKDQCPHCLERELTGTYEESTGATVSPVCRACNWSEDEGCADARCASDDCWTRRHYGLADYAPLSRCCGDLVNDFGYCESCGEHA